MAGVEIEAVNIEKEEEDQVIVGMANFTVKTCDDLFRAIVASVPQVKVGVAMNEAAPKLTRVTGNDDRLEELASENSLRIAASHAFVIMVNGAYPVNLLGAVKSVPGVCNVAGATANPCQVLVAETDLGRGVLGFVDGNAVEAIENERDVEQRRNLVRKIGYPLG